MSKTATNCGHRYYSCLQKGTRLPQLDRTILLLKIVFFLYGLGMSTTLPPSSDLSESKILKCIDPPCLSLPSVPLNYWSSPFSIQISSASTTTITRCFRVVLNLRTVLPCRHVPSRTYYSPSYWFASISPPCNDPVYCCVPTTTPMPFVEKLRNTATDG